MLLDSQTPRCAGWSLAQSIPVAFSHRALVWKPAQWTWGAAEPHSSWRPSPGLRLGTATVDCGKDGASPAQSADQGAPRTARMSLTLELWKRLPRAQRLSGLPAKTPSFCYHPCNCEAVHPAAVFPALTSRLWRSLIKPAVNWFPRWISTTV